MDHRRVLAVILCLPSVALAQEAERLPLRLASAVSTIPIATTVRAATVRGGRTEGALLGFDRTAVTLEVRGTPQRLPLAEVDTLWIRHRSAGRGLLIGGLSALSL